jgi:hypothetical protein
VNLQSIYRRISGHRAAQAANEAVGIGSSILFVRIHRSPGLASKFDGAIDGSGGMHRQDRLNFSSLSSGFGSLLGTSFYLWIRPEAFSKRLASKHNFIDDRWQQSGLIQLIPAKEPQKESHFVYAGWTRRKPGS